MFLVVTILLVATVALLTLEVLRLLRSTNAARWPSTHGRLDHWSLEYEDGGDSTNFNMKGVEFSYEVEGQTFRSESLGFGFPRWMPAEFVETKIADVFRDVPNVTVHYDPAKPAVGVLAAGIGAYHLGKIGALLLVTMTFGAQLMSL